MVKDLNEIISDSDYSSNQDCRNLVFICANEPSFELPNILLLSYPVFENYAEYWEKGRVFEKRNNQLLEELYYDYSKEKIIPATKEYLSRGEKIKLQKRLIKKYLKDNPI